MYWRIRIDKKYTWVVTHNLPYSSIDYLNFENQMDIIDKDLIRYDLDSERTSVVSNIFPSSLFPVLILDKRSFDCLGSFFSESRDRIYNGTVSNVTVKIVAVGAEEFGFDYERSQYDRYDLPPPKNRIRSVKNLRLLTKFKSKNEIFRLRDEYGLRFELICSDIFKSKYEKCKVSGLKFIET